MESTASIAGSGKPPVHIDQVGWADNRKGSAGLTLNSRGVAGPEPAILAGPVQGEWSIVQSCNGKMDQHPIKETPTEARQAVKVRAMRYVLGFGLARGVGAAAGLVLHPIGPRPWSRGSPVRGP